MVHIILTGCTGRAGATILSQALVHPEITRISILSRRPVQLAANSPKTNVILHQDFTSWPSSVLAQLRTATACIWALGTSSVGKTEAEYRKVTVDYPLTFAQAFLASRPSEGSATDGLNFKFIHITGEGVTPPVPSSPESKASKGNLYARVKGEAESSLSRLTTTYSDFEVWNIRPGAIDPRGNHLAERKRNWNDLAIDVVGPAMRRVWKGMHVDVDLFARACLRVAVGEVGAEEAIREEWAERAEGVEKGAGSFVVRNQGLKGLAKSGVE